MPVPPTRSSRTLFRLKGIERPAAKGVSAGGFGVKVHIRRQGDKLIVRLDGDLDLHAAAAFRESVDEQWSASPRLRHLVVDLGGVGFIDSSGLGALLGRWRSVQGRGGRLVAVGVRPRVRKLLEMAGLLQLIDVAEDGRVARDRGAGMP